MSRIDRRGQEEIVGFALIVVLVAVIALVFIGIGIRKVPTNSERESKDISQFLESVMEYTSSCALNYEPAFVSIRELIGECYSNEAKECVSGEKVCGVLEKEIKGIVGTSWKVGNERAIKGYEFKIAYFDEGLEEEILVSNEGNCDSGLNGAEYIIPEGNGIISAKLVLCS
jgi:hypothetical protein